MVRLQTLAMIMVSCKTGTRRVTWAAPGIRPPRRPMRPTLPRPSVPCPDAAAAEAAPGYLQQRGRLIEPAGFLVGYRRQRTIAREKCLSGAVQEFGLGRAADGIPAPIRQEVADVPRRRRPTNA